jgi:hypothetical protein
LTTRADEIGTLSKSRPSASETAAISAGVVAAMASSAATVGSIAG